VSGFLYYVSLTGVTGTKAVSADAAKAAVTRLKKSTDLPIAVGFGVRTPEAAASIARVADAVVVGSHFVDEIRACVEAGRAADAPGRVAASVAAMSKAVRGARESVEA
jgi:tryptophan synthase alpha chain